MQCMIRLYLGVALTLATFAFADLGEDLLYAPPGFSTGGRNLVPIDIQYYTLGITFDTNAKRAVGHARIEFYAPSEGFPILDLVPNPTKAVLNGVDLGTNPMPLTNSPDQTTTQFRYLAGKVKAFSNNLVEIDYELSPSTITFTGSGVRIGFFMSDVSQDRSFWEQFGPANFEYDHHPMEVSLKITGTVGTHQLFTNGEVSSQGVNGWVIRFPEYFNASAPFIHLTDRAMTVKTTTYAGLEKTIPITLYSDSSTLANTALVDIQRIMKELEQNFGPFGHKTYTAYITEGGGGMEYCGATMTSLSALGHETTHSWFARGVMPTNGNSGWIDEAIASWRDGGYSTSNQLPSSTSNMGNFSPYRRTTAMAAYSQGAQLMSYLDTYFSGGLKPVLSQLFRDKKLQGINTTELKGLFENYTGRDLSSLFQKYVTSTNSDWNLGPQLPLPKMFEALVENHHPRPYTPEELVRFR